jgi:3-hydroxyacyl-CoA dehydrogenase
LVRDLKFSDEGDILIQKVLVIGSGTMGKGISRLFKTFGLDITNISARDFQEGFEVTLREFDLIVESVKENYETKIAILNAASKGNTTAIMSSTTSSLSILELQKYVELPNRFCGLHFMNPASVIPVIELTYGENFDPELKLELNEFLVRIRKDSVVTPDIPGFILNALLFPLLNRAAYILQQSGVSAVEIDDLLIKVCGHKLGPLATMDLIGLDITVDILKTLHERDPDFNLAPCELLLQMLHEGKLGKKSRQGFFAY